MAQTLVNPAYWVGGTADYNNQNFWQTSSSSAPGTANAVYFGSQNPNCANDQGSNVVVLIQDGDPLWQHGDTLAGNEAGTSGSYLQTGSTNNTGGGNWLRMAVGDNSFGYYTLSNGVVNCGGQTHIGEGNNASAEILIAGGVYNSTGNFVVGDGDFGVNPVGVLDMNGGTLNVINGELWLGEGHNNTTGGTGTMYMRGGAVTIGNWFAIGRFGGIGDLEMTGGSITKLASPGGNLTIATTPSTGIIDQSGGVITNTATQTWVAESAQGTWNLNGGAAVLGVVHLTQNGVPKEPSI